MSFMSTTLGFRAAGRYLTGSAALAAAIYAAYVGVGWLRHGRGTALGRAW
jgi:hypothetical protein